MVEFRENAGTFLKIITLEAGQAVSLIVVGSALVTDRCANLVGIEGPSFGAGKTHLVVPIPGSASRIGGVFVVGIRENTGTFLKIVSLEAGQAVSGIVVGSALIRNGGANLVGIEGPSFGADEADLIVPIPSSTTRIRRLLIGIFNHQPKLLYEDS